MEAEIRNDGLSEEGMYEEVSKTVETSNDAIFELSNSCSQMVLNIQRANDLRERTRKDTDQRQKQLRIAFMEQKALEAETKLNEINLKWDYIVRFNDSVDIFNACEAQKNQFTDVINHKNNIIETLKNELKKADEKFIRDQQHYRDDVNILANRIDEHVETMRNAYRRHLNLIEEVIEKERKILLYRKQEEWTDLNAKLTKENKKILNDISKTVEDYDENVDDMIWDHYEAYRAAKKNLESDFQTLHIQLEETKATCLLNEKKLEYNYLVLTKRREDLEKIKTKQRRRINRLRDILIEIEKEKIECKTLHSSEVTKLSKIIADMKSNMIHLSYKIARTDEINENTFKKVWQLNEKRAKTLLENISRIDQQLHEQELQIQWTQPNFTRPKMYELPSIQFALRHVPGFQKNNLEAVIEKTSKTIVSESHTLADLPLVKFILQNIVKHIKFTISDQIDSLTKDLSNEKRSIVLYDNVLRILDVKETAELDLMKSHFLQFIKCSTCETKQRNHKLPAISTSSYQKSLASSKRTGSGGKYGKKLFVKRPFSSRVTSKEEITTQPYADIGHAVCKNPQHSWHIDQFSVIEALANFMRERNYRQRKEIKTELSQKTSLIRVLSAKDIEFYWYSFRFKFVEECRTSWDMIYSHWTNYYRLLKDQVDLESTVQHIEKQNSEFKRALNGFNEKNDSDENDTAV